MSQTYPTLSLWQPWASLVAWGLKEWETRGPQTAALLARQVGNEIAIAATKKSPPELTIDEAIFEKACRTLKVWSGGARPNEIFAEGAVLCIVRVVEHPHTQVGDVLVKVGRVL